MSNNLNFLSNTGYLEDALIEFSVRFKRRRLMISSNDYYDHNQHDYNDPFATRFDDLVSTTFIYFSLSLYKLHITVAIITYLGYRFGPLTL